jgi:succinate dehydrogenase hydrophobic anchor subunit
MFMPFAIITSLVMVGMTVSGIYDINNVNGVRDMVNSGIRPTDAAKALQTDWIPAWGATVIFCSGLFGMACGAIAAHMTCCGFIMCEMFGMEHTKWNFRLFAMTPSIGFFGVVIGLPLWFPIAASAICLTMLPVAYLIFLILNNKRSYIGDAVGKGWKRVVFNTLLVLALLMATIGASVLVKVRVIDVLFPPKVQQIVEEPVTDGND